MIIIYKWLYFICDCNYQWVEHFAKGDTEVQRKRMCVYEREEKEEEEQRRRKEKKNKVEARYVWRLEAKRKILVFVECLLWSRHCTMLSSVCELFQWTLPATQWGQYYCWTHFTSEMVEQLAQSSLGRIMNPGGLTAAVFKPPCYSASLWKELQVSLLVILI